MYVCMYVRVCVCVSSVFSTVEPATILLCQPVPKSIAGDHYTQVCVCVCVSSVFSTVEPATILLCQPVPKSIAGDHYTQVCVCVSM